MNKFFWGSNTGRGSVSIATEFFPEAKRRLMIKGGPGTGKSSFLTKVAQKVEDPLLFHCSSAPSSLDAIADMKRGFFLADATHPHILEPELPGTRDEIINFGQFWDRRSLYRSRSSIEEAQKKTTHHFTMAYLCLAKALKIREELEKVVSRDKTVGFVDKNHYQRLFNELKSLYLLQKSDLLGKEERRFISAYTPFGLKTMELDVDKIYIFIGSPSQSKRHLSMLATLFIGAGHDVYLLIDPLDGVSYEGLYVLGEKVKIEVVWPNTFAKGLEAELTEMLTKEETLAIEELNKAYVAHEELEKIYIEAMDYRALEEYQKSIMHDLFEAE